MERNLGHGFNGSGNRRLTESTGSVVRGCKKKWCWFIDIIATYGLDAFNLPGAPEPCYELTVAIWYYSGRVELRRGFTQLQAISGAFSTCVPLCYFEALCDDPDEAEYEHAMAENLAEYEKSRRKPPIEGFG